MMARRSIGQAVAEVQGGGVAAPAELLARLEQAFTGFSEIRQKEFIDLLCLLGTRGPEHPDVSELFFKADAPISIREQ